MLEYYIIEKCGGCYDLKKYKGRLGGFFFNLGFPFSLSSAGSRVLGPNFFKKKIVNIIRRWV